MSNMAIKYNMMKKAKNFAIGGACDAHGDQMCKMCHGGKMAEGGEVEDELFDDDDSALDMVGHIMKKRAKMFAEGGDTDDSTSEPDPSPAPTKRPVVDPDKAKSFSNAFDNNFADGGDVVSSIMKKRGSTPGAKANEAGITADFEPNEFDDMVLDDNLDDFHDTGANSGDELGDHQEDEDRRDIVASIMKSRGKKDRLPRIR